MSRKPLLLVLALALAGCAVAWLVAWSMGEPTPADTPQTQTRIISLIPPITDTLFQLGAQDEVVGRSDYCLQPPAATNLPACGTTLHPNLEAIARLRPTLIVGENSVNAAREQLSGLAPAVFLPWLTRDDVVASTRELGRLTNRQAAADRMADEIAAALPQQAPPTGPRVLLVLPHQPGQLTECWFLRRNSLHGAILHAAGARNAVGEDITGTPSLSLERVLQLDPDVIIILHSSNDLASTERTQLLADWRSLTGLSAARAGRIGLISGAVAYPAGRDIVRLVDVLRAEIDRLKP